MTEGPATDRVRLRRMYERGQYDAASLHAVLDAMPLCSVGYVIDGQPYVTPTLQWREGDHVYWHGSAASRMLKNTKEAQVCLTVSLLDGFVMARSGMHHSINYRSAMLLGTAHIVDDPNTKLARLTTMMEDWFPGRWEQLRAPTDQEMKATTVMSMSINEASAKVRTGGPSDDEEDYALPIWAGEIPIRMEVGEPVPDPRNLSGVELPDHIKNFRVGGKT